MIMLGGRQGEGEIMFSHPRLLPSRMEGIVRSTGGEEQP